jgi:hypothetical protein
MHDSIRYSASSMRMGNDPTKFVYCSRSRCMIKLILQPDNFSNRLPAHTIIINIEDGTSTYHFCSAHCAALWLKTYKPRG